MKLKTAITPYSSLWEYDFEIRDETRGALDKPGDEAFRNITKFEMIDVFVAECNVGRDIAETRVT